ncbi:glycosyltransferase family 4 protein [Thermodesulfobacteriota bacterium]
MKKVLTVGPMPPPRGGIASVMEEIVNSTLRQEYTFDLFSSPFVYPPAVSGVVGKNLIRVRQYLSFYKKCRSGSYRLMHLHSPGHKYLANAVYTLLARMAGIKVLLHLHGNDWNLFYPQAPWFNKPLIKGGVSLASRIVVLHSAWMKGIRELGIAAPVSVLRNMIPPARTYTAGELQEERARTGLNNDDFVVLLAGVGIAERNKGFFDLLEALPAIIAENDDLRFVFAGGDDAPGSLAVAKEIIEREKLGKWLILLGDIERERVHALMEIASIFLLPSYMEGMPIGIIEALRSRAVVITTPVGGIPDMIDDEKSGLFIEVGSPEGIADAVLRVKRDEALRERLAQEGLIAFHEKFDLDKGVEVIREIYEELERL